MSGNDEFRIHRSKHSSDVLHYYSLKEKWISNFALPLNTSFNSYKEFILQKDLILQLLTFIKTRYKYLQQYIIYFDTFEKNSK